VPTTVTAKDRVLAAALTEFAQHGVAGARVDRIARSAKTSKERVYAYFRSKEQLYAEVAAGQLAQIMEGTELDPADLPGYVGELFDFYVEHPELLRLASWSRLETDESLVGLGAAGNAALRVKLEAIERGQREGVLDDAFAPVDVLLLLTNLSMGWLSAVELHPLVPDDLARRRAAAVLAAERLFS
jgi:AcrR family transcriptional regulator